MADPECLEVDERIPFLVNCGDDLSSPVPLYVLDLMQQTIDQDLWLRTCKVCVSVLIVVAKQWVRLQGNVLDAGIIFWAVQFAQQDDWLCADKLCMSMHDWDFGVAPNQVQLRINCLWCLGVSNLFFGQAELLSRVNGKECVGFCHMMSVGRRCCPQ